MVVVSRPATDSDEFFACRLNVTRCVDATRPDLGFAAVPVPGEAESHQRVSQHGLLKLCLLPGLSPVGGDFHGRDVRTPRPNDTGVLADYRPRHAGATQSAG